MESQQRKCILCEDTLYVKIPRGVAPCTSCDEGKRVEALREAHRNRYSPRRKARTYKPRSWVK